MMDRKAIEILSLLMVCLIISVPFNISSAFAATGQIRDVQYHGQDNATGFVRNYNDALHISLDARRLDDGGNPVLVTADNVQYSLDGSANAKMGSCEAKGDDGWYNCIFTGNARDWSPKRYQFKARLYDDAFLMLDEFTGNLFVDILPPMFSSVDMPSSTGNSNFTVSFSAVDRACDACGSSCIGLDRIALNIGEDEKFSKDLDGSCSYFGSFDLNPSSLDIEEGTNEVCLVIYDRGGLFYEQCGSFSVDYNPPEILDSGVMLLDKQGNEIDYSSSQKITADVVAEIQEFGDSGIDASGLRANLSDLYPASGDYPDVAADSCIEDNNTFTCTWKDIDVYEPADPAILSFIIKDRAGNEARREISLSLPLDTVPPDVIEIRTENSGYLKRLDNTIVVAVSDQGSGMSKAEAYLNLRELGPSYGVKAKADECEDIGGEWECYWHGLNVVGKGDGDILEVSITSLEDNAGLNYDRSLEASSVELTYDDHGPMIEDVKIGPLGSDLDVLLKDDVVEITASIKEEHSGISAERAFANFADFDRSFNWTSANRCEDINSTHFECTWEYSGPLLEGNWVNLDFRIKDDAGNEVLQRDIARVYVSDVVEDEADFWMQSAGVSINTKLNPNFLWMSSSGTIIRTTLQLLPKAKDSYVHSFEINDCKGRLTGGVADFESFSIISQFYPPGKKESKYVLIDVPSYSKDAVSDASSVEIICNGEVMQSRSQFSPIYRPNEIVNATINLEILRDSMFTAPETSSLNKIRYSQSEIEQIDDIIEILDGLSFLKPLCQGFSTVMSLISNGCILWTGIKSVFFGSSSVTNDCSSGISILNKIWYGDENIKEAGFGYGFLNSKYNALSLGFVCDLYLCSGCSEQWNGAFTKGFGLFTGEERSQGFLEEMAIGFNFGHKNQGQNKVFFGERYADKENSANYVETGKDDDNKAVYGTKGTAVIRPTSLSFDPFTQLPVAVLCMPPCLSGIKNNLVMYKQILVDYNVCMNVAAIRGYGSAECETFKSSHTCQLIVRWLFFTDTIAAFILNYIANTVMSVIEAFIQKMCTVGTGPDSAQVPLCAPKVIISVLEWFLTLEEVVQQIENLGELEMTFERENKVREDVESELGEEDYGNVPYLE